MARVRAVLRRVEVLSSETPGPCFEAGDLRIDFGEQRVYLRDREVRLTPTEYRLLSEMVRQPGRVLVPDYLLERVWSEGYAGENRVLRLAIHRLRQKIEIDPQQPQYIQTRPGMGYIFVIPEQT
jgi:DNA-binding response OmpR family regulator